jgi:hypothetical protein
MPEVRPAFALPFSDAVIALTGAQRSATGKQKRGETTPHLGRG